MKIRYPCITTTSSIGSTGINTGFTYYMGGNPMHSEVGHASYEGWLLAGKFMGDWSYED